jgi:hypothetical protein
MDVKLRVEEDVPKMNLGTRSRVRERNYCPKQELAAVVADGFHGTAFHRFLAKLFLFGRGGLLVNVGVAAIIIAAKIARGGFAAEIAVDTLVIDIELACEVFGIAVSDVSHNNLSERQAYRRQKQVQ